MCSTCPVFVLILCCVLYISFFFIFLLFLFPFFPFFFLFSCYICIYFFALSLDIYLLLMLSTSFSLGFFLWFAPMLKNNCCAMFFGLHMFAYSLLVFLLFCVHMLAYRVSAFIFVVHCFAVFFLLRILFFNYETKSKSHSQKCVRSSI